MKKPDAHRKLMSLLCLLLLAAAGPALLSACSGLFPDGPKTGLFESYDQVADSFDRIVPGMTQAQDLKGFGFDTLQADLLPAREVARRFHADPGVAACLDAGPYCSALAFHPGHGARWSADVTLLVMNGRVIHKVFSGSPERILGIFKV